MASEPEDILKEIEELVAKLRSNSEDSLSAFQKLSDRIYISWWN